MDNHNHHREESTPVEDAHVSSSRWSYSHKIRMRRIAAFFIVLAVIGLMIAVPLRIYYDTWQHGKELIHTYHVLQKDVYEKSKIKQAHNDAEWVKSQARGRLLMVFPGEIPYRLEVPAPQDPTIRQRKQQERDSHVWFTAVWNDLSVPH